MHRDPFTYIIYWNSMNKYILVITFISYNFIQIITMEDRPLYTTTVRKIGNSNGVLLSKAVLKKLKIENGQAIDFILKEDDTLVLKPVKKIIKPKRNKLNLSLATWDKQFQQAIQNKELPETDVFERLTNKFDEHEW
jgi:antitoxin component of MazEF toxin-antitoxin module